MPQDLPRRLVPSVLDEFSSHLWCCGLHHIHSFQVATPLIKVASQCPDISSLEVSKGCSLYLCILAN